MVRERKKKEERERKEKLWKKRDVLSYFTVFAHVLHFKIKYVRVIHKYELSS